MIRKIPIKFLGTSSVESIPRPDCDCPQCKSKDSKDNRKRSSILIDQKILVDVTPDILHQLRRDRIEKLDMLITTHDHEDHIGGLQHVLRLNPDINVMKMKPGQHFKIFGIDFFAFKVEHSNLITTIGLVINDLIYIPDSASLASAQSYLGEAKYAVLDGSVVGRAFGGHLPVGESVALTKPMTNLKKIYFTHNGHTRKTHQEMQKLIKDLGDSRFEIAYDRLEFEI